MQVVGTGPQSSSQFSEELSRLRVLLAQELGVKKLSMEVFARELAKRLGREKTPNPSTVWRWLQGRATPPRAVIGQVRALLHGLSPADSQTTPAEIASHASLKEACLETRVRISALVLERCRDHLGLAETVAFAVEKIILDIGDDIGITHGDATVSMWHSVLSALPSADAFELLRRAPQGTLENTDEVEHRYRAKLRVMTDIIDLIRRLRIEFERMAEKSTAGRTEPT